MLAHDAARPSFLHMPSCVFRPCPAPVEVSRASDQNGVEAFYCPECDTSWPADMPADTLDERPGETDEEWDDRTTHAMARPFGVTDANSLEGVQSICCPTGKLEYVHFANYRRAVSCTACGQVYAQKPDGQ